MEAVSKMDYEFLTPDERLDEVVKLLLKGIYLAYEDGDLDDHGYFKASYPAEEVQEKLCVSE